MPCRASWREAADDFFGSAPAETQVAAEVVEKMTAFVANARGAGRRVAVVTSGGTSVPLERRTVRHIENFSTGNRGSALTEALLRAGYAVILAWRRGSSFPFARGLGQRLSTEPQDVVKSGWSGDAAAPLEHLCVVSFASIYEYLWTLRRACETVSGVEALVVCAAAVSDFYVRDLPEHKIQSRDGGLDIRLEQVPKMLGLVKSCWCPDATVVSFKLETDAGLLEAKARGALDAYGVDAVVANLLDSYKTRATAYELDSSETFVGDVDAQIARALVRAHSRRLTHCESDALVDSLGPERVVDHDAVDA